MKKYILLPLALIIVSLFIFYGIDYAQTITFDPLQIRCVEYTLPTQDSSLNGLSIVVVSDLHLRENYPDLKILTHLVDSINAKKADFCFLLGDYIDGRIGHHPILEDNLVEAFSHIQAKRGIYGVLGNHDWYYGPIKILSLFKKIKIPILRNEWVQDGDFYIIGVDDYLFDAQDVSSAFKGLPKDAKNIFFLAHHPMGALLLKSPVTLALAGHTHGGQILFPFLDRPVFCESIVRSYPRGIFYLNKSPFIVTSGIGNSVLNLRAGVEAEFVFIKFVMEN